MRVSAEMLRFDEFFEFGNLTNFRKYKNSCLRQVPICSRQVPIIGIIQDDIQFIKDTVCGDRRYVPSKTKIPYSMLFNASLFVR